ncbi:MAG: hypothetical protein MRZ79_15175 [Bacteroidia bacterium]|nr:hypothetical protein [Bacteroidia bacterium]
MPRQLNFICPTDYLESTITRQMKGKHYFFTSLGNSLSLDRDILLEIKGFLTVNDIRNISFILSDDNQIVLDAFQNQKFPHIWSLHKLYSDLSSQAKRFKEVLNSCDLSIFLLSYYLNMRISELQPNLDNWFDGELRILGKIYHRQQDVFQPIHSEVFFREKLSLN